jgi:hypothetical protein
MSHIERRGNALKRVRDWLGGKSIAFATFFAINGTILAYLHRLDVNYSLLVTAIQGLVVVRSVAQDRYPSIPPEQSIVPKEKDGPGLKVEIKKEGG